MTSKFKVQGSLKGLLAVAAVAALSLTSLQASAQASPRGSGPRGAPPEVRQPITRVPPKPSIVVPPCKRGGPGITPC